MGYGRDTALFYSPVYSGLWGAICGGWVQNYHHPVRKCEQVQWLLLTLIWERLDFTLLWTQPQFRNHVVWSKISTPSLPTTTLWWSSLTYKWPYIQLTMDWGLLSSEVLILSQETSFPGQTPLLSMCTVPVLSGARISVSQMQGTLHGSHTPQLWVKKSRCLSYLPFTA